MGLYSRAEKYRAIKEPNIPERDVVKSCLAYLRIRGVLAWRNNTGALMNKDNRPVRFGKPGSSDIIGVLPGGRFIAVECKGSKGRLSDKQREFLDSVGRMGGLAVVARGIGDIEKALEEAGAAIKRRRNR